MQVIKWTFISGARFAYELRKLGGTNVFPRIPKTAYGFKTNGTNLMCTVGNYEHEFSNIGCHRFRDKDFGPWSIWKG